LKDTGVRLTEKAIRNGLKKVKENTYFIGRWMVRQQKPLIIFDSAHNEGGLKSLVQQTKLLSFEKLHFVYGTVADKDLSNIFSLLPKKQVIISVSPIFRAVKTKKNFGAKLTLQALKENHFRL
jgi:dihydrofolate synthase/folylpolyglutamate synthase